MYIVSNIMVHLLLVLKEIMPTIGDANWYRDVEAIETFRVSHSEYYHRLVWFQFVCLNAIVGAL